MSIGNGHSLFCECEDCRDEEQMTSKSQTNDVAQPEPDKNRLMDLAEEIEDSYQKSPIIQDIVLNEEERRMIVSALHALAAQPPAAPVETDGEKAARDYEHGYNDGVEWAQTHGRCSAGNARGALDDSQSLLVMLLHLGTGRSGIGISSTAWNDESLTTLLTEQIETNRSALTFTEPQTVPQSGLKVELAARNLRILGLEKSLDDAVVALQGILEHPGDEESWKEARKVLPSLLRLLDDGPLDLPAPGAPLHKGNAHQRPGIPGSPDAPGKSDRMADGWPRFWAWEKKGDPVGLMLPNEAARAGFFAGVAWMVAGSYRK